MKSTALAALAATVLVLPAAAADMMDRATLIKALMPRTFSWTGAYAGANAGYGGGDVSSDSLLFSANSLTTLSTFKGATANASGFVAGGQAGFNYQLPNRFVLGAEADLQWSGIAARDQQQAFSPPGAMRSASADLNYFGTVRARLGYAMDRFMPYVTGGVAYGRAGFGHTARDLTGGFSAYSSSALRWGWAAGAGAEAALTDHWTMRAEYLYVDLGSPEEAHFDPAADLAALTAADLRFQTLRAGVNYKF
ncbi:outer membrane beta-barrel protein [Xanthobacter sp. V2C-8]|uniref:outer membrane protein n=1 Tax=Xanthobacter albus TaxID=3119929 RepID=UPI003726F007